MTIVLDGGICRQRASLNLEQFEQYWADLRHTMDCIFIDSMDDCGKFTIPQSKWHEGFSTIYMIINAGPNPHCENLYNNVRQYLLQQVGLKRHEIFQDENMDDDTQKTPILTQYYYSWKQYEKALKHYDSFFHCLNALYVKHNRQMEQSYNFLPQKPPEIQTEDMDVGFGFGTQTRSMKSRTANAAAAASEEAMACNDKYPVRELGLRVWKNVMDECLRKKIIPKLLEVLHAHRTGDYATIRWLLKGVTPDDIGEDAVLFPVISHILKSVILPDDTRRSVAFQFYQQILEKPYLDASMQFFTVFSKETRETKSTAQYVETMLRMSELEVVRATTFMHTQSHVKLSSMVRQVFVQDNKDFILGDVGSVIESGDWDIFQKKYIILRSVPEGLRELCKAYQTYLEGEGHRRLKPYLRQPNEFVQEVLSFYDESHADVKKLFRLEDESVSKDFMRAVDNACRTVVNVKDDAASGSRSQPHAPVSSLLAQYCDRILKEKGQDEEYYTTRLNNAVRVFEHIEDRDLFEQFYRSKLAGRLIKNTKASMNAEKQMIENLRQVAGYDFISSLNRMMKDIQTCDNATEEFRKEKEKYRSASILECKIIQQGAWPFSDNKKSLVIPADLQGMLDEFTSFYQQSHASTKLTWLFNWSSCDLSYTIGTTKYRLQAMTPQYLVLNQYNQGDSFKLAELLKSTGIEYVELERTVQSLVRVELLTTSDVHTIQLSSDIQINPDFSHKKVKIDLLKKFRDSKPAQKRSSGKERARGATDSTAMKQIADAVEEEGIDAKQLEDDRRIYIQAALVRIMKSYGKITHALLLSECITAAKSRFKPQVSQVKYCIEALIDKQYVVRINVEDSNEIMYEYIS